MSLVKASLMHVNTVIADLTYDKGVLVGCTHKEGFDFENPYKRITNLAFLDTLLKERKLSPARPNRASYFKTNPRNAYEELLETNGFSTDDSCWVRFDSLGQGGLSYESFFR